MKKRVGFWFAESKLKKLELDVFAASYKSDDLEFVQLDLDQPASQGHCHLIVNKFIELLVAAEEGDAESNRRLELFRAHLRLCPSVILLDPVDRFSVMINRAEQYQLSTLCSTNPSLRNRVFVPSFVQLTGTDVSANLKLMRTAGVSFPIVCKPVLAHGSTLAHEMSIIFNESGLSDAVPPCVVQSFVNHDAKLHKIFVVGEGTHICERPSIKNISADSYERTIFFYSHDVSKDESNSDLSKVRLVPFVRAREANHLDESDRASLVPHEVDQELLMLIAAAARDTFKLDLLGIDVIVDRVSRRYAIIDVNFFPGYEKMPDFHSHLDRLVRSKLSLPQRSTTP